jgi:hypothetical protein
MVWTPQAAAEPSTLLAAMVAVPVALIVVVEKQARKAWMPVRPLE